MAATYRGSRPSPGGPLPRSPLCAHSSAIAAIGHFRGGKATGWWLGPLSHHSLSREASASSQAPRALWLAWVIATSRRSFPEAIPPETTSFHSFSLTAIPWRAEVEDCSVCLAIGGLSTEVRLFALSDSEVSRELKEGSVRGTECEQPEFTEGPDARVAQPGSGRSRSCPGFSLQPLPPGDFRRFGAAAPHPLRAEPQLLTTAMSSDFEGYEQDFAVLTAEITSKIGRVPKLSADEKKQMVANVEKQLEEAKELLEQMDLEVREIPPQNRGMYTSRMRSYKQEMGKLETDFNPSF
ncbi:uncharacterized protein ACOB8E_010081 [Sarcophilus harrisii]